MAGKKRPADALAPRAGEDGTIRYGTQAVTDRSSRNQPSPVTEQSVIDVKPMRTDWPAQPPLPPVARLHAASRSTVVLVKVLAVPVNTEAPAEPAGGQEALIVPL